MAKGFDNIWPNSAASLFNLHRLATQIGYTGTIRGLLLFPDPTCDPELQLLPITTGEEQGHVPLDDEAVMAVPHLPVAVADAPGGALPNHLPAIGTHLKAVAVVLRLVLVSHETKEGHVYWCHPKLEGLKVQAEVLPEAVKHCQHPGGVFHFSWVRFHVSVVECATAMHINFVIIPQMGNKIWDVASSGTLRPSIGAIIRSEVALCFMFYLAVVWKDFLASQGVVLAGKFKRLGYFLQCQTPDITKLLSACRATIVHSSLAC